jgi:hypothetical protein
MTTACGPFTPPEAGTRSALPPLPGQRADVFTTARPTAGAAVREFFGLRPPAIQPIQFPHNTHVERKVPCAYCHQRADKGAAAGLPGMKLCMTCHQAIATDRPRIKEIAGLNAKGLDLDWQRVYGFVAESHVRFVHSAHVRAKVECATCHGDVAKQTVAQQNVRLTMGFCVKCHNAQKASIDCVMCHN